MSDSGFSLRSYLPDIAQHSHDHHQLVLPVSGQLTLQIEQHEGHADAQHLAVIPAGHTHAFAGSDHNRFIVVDLPQRAAPMLDTLPAFLPISSPVQHYIQFLSALLSDSRTQAQSTSLELLLQLLNQHATHPLYDARMHTIARSIRDRLALPLSVSQLAADACLSERQFRQRFKTALGLSPLQYILQQRIALAQQLLSHTTLPVYQIAERAGFNDVAQFSRQFLQHTGMSATSFRRKPQH